MRYNRDSYIHKNFCEGNNSVLLLNRGSLDIKLKSEGKSVTKVFPHTISALEYFLSGTRLEQHELKNIMKKYGDITTSFDMQVYEDLIYRRHKASFMAFLLSVARTEFSNSYPKFVKVLSQKDVYDMLKKYAGERLKMNFSAFSRACDMTYCKLRTRNGEAHPTRQRKSTNNDSIIAGFFPRFVNDTQALDFYTQIIRKGSEPDNVERAVYLSAMIHYKTPEISSSNDSFTKAFKWLIENAMDAKMKFMAKYRFINYALNNPEYEKEYLASPLMTVSSNDRKEYYENPETDIVMAIHQAKMYLQTPNEEMANILKELEGFKATDPLLAKNLERVIMDIKQLETARTLLIL